MRDDIFGCGVFTDDDIAALLVGFEHADHLIWNVCNGQEEGDAFEMEVNDETFGSDLFIYLENKAMA